MLEDYSFQYFGFFAQHAFKRPVFINTHLEEQSPQRCPSWISKRHWSPWMWCILYKLLLWK